MDIQQRSDALYRMYFEDQCIVDVPVAILRGMLLLAELGFLSLRRVLCRGNATAEVRIRNPG